MVLQCQDQASKVAPASTFSAGQYTTVNRLCTSPSSLILEGSRNPIAVRNSYIQISYLVALVAVLSESCSRSCSRMLIADLCGDMQGSVFICTNERAMYIQRTSLEGPGKVE